MMYILCMEHHGAQNTNFLLELKDHTIVYNCMTFHVGYKIAIYHLQFYRNLKNLEHKN
jgi:hypothetical protein